MRKTITIDGKDVELKATASTLRKYRNWFGRDLIHDFTKVRDTLERSQESSGEIIEIIQNLTYTMARQANDSIPASVDDWLDQFDTFPIEDIAYDVVIFWASSVKANVELKNA